METCFSRKQNEVTIAKRIAYAFYFIELRSDFSVPAESSCEVDVAAVSPDNRREEYYELEEETIRQV